MQWIIYVHRIICWDDDGAYVYVGTQMELTISFSDLIHAYKGLSVNALNDYMRTRVLKDDRSRCKHQTHNRDMPTHFAHKGVK